MFLNGMQIVKNDLGYKQTRAGVIPYTIDKRGKLYFMLGIDEATRELTDFGGGVKQGESIFETAHRELLEESCCIFSNCISLQDIKNSPVLLNSKGTSALFFVKIDSFWLTRATTIFAQNRAKLPKLKKYFEMYDIIWLNEKDFVKIAFDINTRYMWSRIQNMIRSNITWEQLKLSLQSGELISMLNNKKQLDGDWRHYSQYSKPLQFNWRWRKRVQC